jgi:hypothetical protein
LRTFGYHVKVANREGRPQVLTWSILPIRGGAIPTFAEPGLSRKTHLGGNQSLVWKRDPFRAQHLALTIRKMLY